jgi:hypothetical protein
MIAICPECSKAVPEQCRLPFVCGCTKAVLTTKEKWLIPSVTQKTFEARKKKEATAKIARQHKEERGRQLWAELHCHLGSDPEFYSAWRAKILQEKCGCSKHFLDMERTHPINLSDSASFFESSIAMHNAVNERLKKPILSIEEAYTLWRHRRPSTNRTRCIVTVAVGDECQAISQLTKPFMQAYADRCDADLICLTNRLRDWWGLEKFRTYYFASQYEECLFLDADVVVKPDAPSIFDRKSSVAIHDEASFHTSLEWLEKERSSVRLASGVNVADSSQCFNSGVVYVRRQAANVWLPPEVAIGSSHCAEQIWVQHQAAKHDVELLDFRWNWCGFFGKFETGIDDAWLVHFANTHPKLERIKRLIDTL